MGKKELPKGGKGNWGVNRIDGGQRAQKRNEGAEEEDQKEGKNGKERLANF